MSCNILLHSGGCRLCEYWKDANGANAQFSRYMYMRDKSNCDTTVKQTHFRLLRQGALSGFAGAYITACNDADACNKCVTVRVNTDKFKMRKSHAKKTEKLLQLSNASFEKSVYSPEYYNFAKEYLVSRHNDVGSEKSELSLEDFKDVYINNSDQLFVLRDNETGELISLAFAKVLDNEITADCIAYSAKYKNFSPGTVTINTLLQSAKESGIDYVYIGAWAEDSPKLGYKAQYNGLETIIDGQWVDFNPEKHTQGHNNVAMLRSEGFDF